MPLVPASFFGMTTTTVGAQSFPSIPFFGIRMWDTQITWKDIETNNGVFNWTLADQWVAEAVANGKDILYTFGKVPTWAGGGASFVNPPSDVDSGNALFQAFVTALVTRYKGQIGYYEVWNEPDLDWNGTAAQLVKMAQTIVNTVRSIDSSAKIVGPSPSTANQFGVHFLPSYYAAGGAPLQDIVGCHAYLYTTATPATFATVPESLLDGLSSLKTLMSANGVGSLPIWYTEGTWGGSAGGVDNNATMSDDQKIGYIGREYCLMAANGVARYYWYAWNNPNWGTMWSAAGGVNAIGAAYQILNGWLSGSTINSLTQQPDGSQVMSITRPDTTSALIAWHTASGQYNTTFTNQSTLLGGTTPVVGGFVATGPKPILLWGSTVSHTYTVTSAVTNGDLVSVAGSFDGKRVSAQVSQQALNLAVQQGSTAVQNLVAAAFAAAAAPTVVSTTASIPLTSFIQ